MDQLLINGLATMYDAELCEELGVSAPTIRKRMEELGLKRDAAAIRFLFKRNGIRMRDLYMRERVREKYGLPKQTRLNTSERDTRASNRRAALKEHGYIVDRCSFVAYYTDTTRRSRLMESRYRNFYFKPISNEEHSNLL